MQDLSNHSLVQLRNLDLQVTQELKRRHYQGVNQARQQILDIAQNAGISLDDLLSANSSNKPTVQRRAAIYRSPENPSYEWSGRGRKPSWIKEWEASGRKLDDTRV